MFIKRFIIYSLICVICFSGFWVYNVFFAEIRQMEIVTIESFTLAVWRSTVFGLILAYFDPLRLDPFRLQKKEIRQKKKESRRKKKKARDGSSDDFSEHHERGPSKTAKASLALGAAAYAKASRKPKIPQVVPRNAQEVRNIQVQHKHHDTYHVFCETWYNESVGWVRSEVEINPAFSGHSWGGPSIDIRWR